MIPQSHTNPIHVFPSADSQADKDSCAEHLVDGLWVDPPVDDTAAGQAIKERVLGHRDDLSARAKERLEQMIHQLVTRSTVGEDGQSDREAQQTKKQWEKTVYALATRAVESVMPQVPLGDMMDIRPYVNVKAIAGGSMDECMYVAGVVARKQVAHRKMRHRIHQPRLMLLAGSLQFQRVEQQMSSLDTLLEQERRYLEILVQKIANLKPDLLLVRKSVSRQAQELLREKSKIVVIMNVKQSLMERIARRTGAMIIASIDHVDKVGEDAIGHCLKFSMRSFKTDLTVAETEKDYQLGRLAELQQKQAKERMEVEVDQKLREELSPRNPFSKDNYYEGDKDKRRSSGAGAAVAVARAAMEAMNGKDGGEKGGEGAGAGAAVQDEMTKVVRPNRLRIKYEADFLSSEYMVLDGCPKVLGCTLVLRGGAPHELAQLKQIVNFAAFVAYSLKLETAYLEDTGVVITGSSPNYGKLTEEMASRMERDLKGQSAGDSDEQQQEEQQQQQQEQEQAKIIGVEGQADPSAGEAADGKYADGKDAAASSDTNARLQRQGRAVEGGSNGASTAEAGVEHEDITNERRARAGAMLSCSLGVQFEVPIEALSTRMPLTADPTLSKRQQEQQEQRRKMALSPEQHQRIYVAECWMVRSRRGPLGGQAQSMRRRSSAAAQVAPLPLRKTQSMASQSMASIRGTANRAALDEERFEQVGG
jgi:hypothetical protein